MLIHLILIRTLGDGCYYTILEMRKWRHKEVAELTSGTVKVKTKTSSRTYFQNHAVIKQHNINLNFDCLHPLPHPFLWYYVQQIFSKQLKVSDTILESREVAVKKVVSHNMPSCCLQSNKENRLVNHCRALCLTYFTCADFTKMYEHMNALLGPSHGFGRANMSEGS